MAEPVSLLAEATSVPTLKVRDVGGTIGTIRSFLIDKASGRATHAVLSLGGFLGMGKSFYPVPFGLLAYDAAHDRYAVTVERRVLEGGPSWSSNAPAFDQAYADRVASYYGASPAPLADDGAVGPVSG